MKRPSLYWIVGSGSSGGAIGTTVTFNLNGSGIVAGVFLVIKDLYSYAYYSAPGTPTQLIKVACSCSLTGVNGTTFKMVRAAAAGNAAANFAFPTDLYIRGSDILVGEVGRIADPTLSCSVDSLANLTAAGVGTITGIVMLGIEFWDKKSAKQEFDI